MKNYMSTYSVIGYDENTSELGAAVQSKFLSVGSLCPFVKSGVGAVSTQAQTNSGFGYKSFKLLEEGADVRDIVNMLLENDINANSRQFAVIDKSGKAFAYTGKGCLPYAGHITGKNYSCQGNFLHGENVLTEMAKAFENTKGDLAEKLLCSLIAAQEAGGEKRGQQSAALIVKRSGVKLLGEMDVVADLRVDDHLSPLLELKRLLEKHRVYFSRNYADRFYDFKGETKQAVFEIITTLKLHKKLPDNIPLKEQLTEYGRSIGLEAFRGNRVNGRLIDNLVNKYYNLEEE